MDLKKKLPWNAAYERLPLVLKIHKLRARGWKKIFQTSGNQKKVGLGILISEKTDFKLKMVKKDKEGDYIMIKGSMHQEDLAVVYIYPTLEHLNI